MAKTVVMLLVGAAAGSAATYFAFVDARESNGTLAPALLSRDAAPSYDQAVLLEAIQQPAAAAPVSERLAVYEIAGGSNPEDLESLIEQAAAQRLSAGRSLQLDALLMGLAEHDPQRAVRFARALRLETRFLLPLFQYWAEHDSSAALAEIRTLENRATVRSIALALLDVFGNNESGISQLSSVLPEADMHSFRIDAIARLAEHDPFGALQSVLSLADSATRGPAISRIASVWARQDPLAALAQVGTIADDELRRAYQTGVVSEWAALDSAGVLAYLQTADAANVPLNVTSSALQTIANGTPLQLLATANALRGDVRRFAQTAALQVLAQRDPALAIAHLETLPRNQDREQLLQAVASGYARQDPEAALAWVESLNPPSRSAMLSVVSAIAAVDLDRALDLATANTADPLLSRVFAMSLFNGAQEDSQRMATIADKLADTRDPRSLSQISSLVSNWARRDPEAAVAWTLENVDRAGRQALTQVARTLATTDPELAIRYLDQVPPELRGEWISTVAAGYSQYDPEAAVEWIARYQGQPGYEAGLTAIAQQTAQIDPQAAARLLDRVDVRMQTMAAPQVASVWAQREPAAAAQWAMRLSDSQARTRAVSTVVGAWGSQNPDEARRWAMSLPSSEMRDQSLGALVAIGMAADGTIDNQLLQAFSSDAARQQGVLRGLSSLANRDPNLARAAVDTYITDPNLRRLAEDMMSRQPSTIFFNSGIPIYIP